MNHHFGELGDVWKHLPLAEILRTRPARHYWETHAGSASYPLFADEPRVHGCLRFLAEAPSDPDLADCAYLAALRSSPGTYPGSATLAMRELGPHASYVLCDVDRESVVSLRLAFAGMEAMILEEDGVASIARRAQTATARPADVLVHIDPFEPLERATPSALTAVELAGHLACLGFRLFFWYGYDDVARRGWARDAIAALAPGVALWCGDAMMPAALVYPGRAGAWGCGVVLANFEPEEVAICERLGRGLERAWRSDTVEGNEPARLTFSVLA